MSIHRKKKVVPSDTNVTIEIRPGRHLRVQHFNATPRDAKFENEMKLYMQYKHSFSSGPLTMPQKMEALSKTNPVYTESADPSFSLPNFVGETEYPASSSVSKITLSDKDNNGELRTAIDNSSLSNSVFSSPSCIQNSRSENIRSASSVDVVIKGKQGKGEFSLKQVKTNVPTDITEAKCENIDEISSTKVHTNNCSGDGADASQIDKAETAPICSPTVVAEVQTYSSITQSDNSKQDSCLEHPSQSETESSSFSNTSLNKNQDLALFFFHGVGGSSDIWCAQTKYFTHLGLEVIVPDLIGHGFSCAPKQAKAYHFKEIAADLEILFDKLCKRKNIIIGHSYG